MILGNVCTRNCSFCAVNTGLPLKPDPREPERIAAAAAEMELKHVVITSVTRDDLPDGGASHFAAVIRAIRKLRPDAGVEILTPDFMGDMNSLETVLEAGPDVFNHNMETVRRLYPAIRPLADYDRSLRVLQRAGETSPNVMIKSGFMLGLGETYTEVDKLLCDIRETGCEAVTIGQYLRPAKTGHPVVQYIIPAVFDGFGDRARMLGFSFVASAPLVRSSINAGEIFRELTKARAVRASRKGLD